MIIEIVYNQQLLTKSNQYKNLQDISQDSSETKDIINPTAQQESQVIKKTDTKSQEEKRIKEANQKKSIMKQITIETILIIVFFIITLYYIRKNYKF